MCLCVQINPNALAGKQSGKIGYMRSISILNNAAEQQEEEIERTKAYTQPKTSLVTASRQMVRSSICSYGTAPTRTAHLAQQTTSLRVLALQRH
jgi:hypothetical protein